MLKDYYQFAKQNYHFLSFGLLTAFFGNYGQTFFIAWFGQSFQTDFGLSNASYGMVYSSATLASGFLILYVGALLDKTPLLKFTLLTALGLACACILLYFSGEIWHLVIAIFLLRFCGQGLMTHIAYTSMARYYEANRGKAIGIVGFGMPLGEAVMPAIAVSLISTIGWRATWLILALILIVFYLPTIIYLVKKSHQRLQQITASNTQNSKGGNLSWTRKQVIQDYRFWLLIPIVMAPAFIITGVFIHQKALLLSQSWSPGWFAFCFVIYAISHLKSSLITGSLVDKYSGKTLIQFYLFPLLAGLLLLVLPFKAEMIALLMMLLFGLTVGASGPIVNSIWVEIYGHKHIGAIRSTVTSIMVISTAISPVLLGWLLDHNHSYTEVVSYLAGYVMSGIILLRLLLTKSFK